MSYEALSRPELERRLAVAEAVVDSLQAGEVDAVLSSTGVLLLRLSEAEAALRRSRDELEGRVHERTAELDQANRQLQQTLAEKVVLLREVHHRAKNDLQVVSSLLRFKETEASNHETQEVLRDSRQRIQAMVAVHDALDGVGRSGEVDLARYLGGLATDLAAGSGRREVRVEVQAEPVSVGLGRASRVGLVVNELLANAFKHAFPSGDPGTVRVSVQEVGGEVRLEVEDDGIGMPPDAAARAGQAAGLALVRDLVELQLGGRIEVAGRPSGGTCAVVSFPK